LKPGVVRDVRDVVLGRRVWPDILTDLPRLHKANNHQFATPQ
jgi:hypothetical protein